MRTIAWVMAAAAGPMLLGGCYSSGCPDESYELELGVTVAPGDCPEGAHVLRGDADGVPFSCALDCRREGGVATIEPGACEGAVVETWSDGTVLVKLPGTPERAAAELVAAGSDEPLERRELQGGTGSGCGGPELFLPIKESCDEGLTVTLPSRLSGDYVFEGTADGAAFRCTYAVVQLGPEANEVRNAACDAALVALAADHFDDGFTAYDSLRAAFPAGPAVVAWSVTDVTDAETSTGTLAPTYAFDRSGCRVATAEVP